MGRGREQCARVCARVKTFRGPALRSRGGSGGHQGANVKKGIVAHSQI